MSSRSNLELRTQSKKLPYKTGTDTNGNRVGPRPTVGPADPATRRRLLDQRLNERQPATSRPPPARAKREPTQDPNAFKVDRAATDLRYRGTRIDEAVDKNSN